MDSAFLSPGPPHRILAACLFTGVFTGLHEPLEGGSDRSPRAPPPPRVRPGAQQAPEKYCCVNETSRSLIQCMRDAKGSQSPKKPLVPERETPRKGSAALPGAASAHLYAQVGLYDDQNQGPSPHRARSGRHTATDGRANGAPPARGLPHYPLRSVKPEPRARGRIRAAHAQAARTPGTPDPHLCVCAMLGAEASSSSAEQGGSGGAPRFTRANTLTVAGSQLDGLLEERTRGGGGVAEVAPPPERDPKSPGLWRQEEAEGLHGALKAVRSRSWGPGASGVTREVITKFPNTKNHRRDLRASGQDRPTGERLRHQGVDGPAQAEPSRGPESGHLRL